MPTSEWSVTKLRLWAFVEVPLPRNSLPFDEEGELLPGVVAYPQRGNIPKSYAEVVHLDVISYQSDWDLNSIPSGSIQVAVGRRADNPSVISLIHDLVDDMQIMLRCQVWMHVMEQSNFFEDGSALDPWPEDPFVCFDGYVCGTGFSKARSGGGNEASFRLDLTHWLSDLNFSSSLSRTSHQVNPSQYSFPAAFQGGAGNMNSFVAATMAVHHFQPIKVATDFWGISTMGWLKELCKLDRFNVREVPSILSDPLRGANFEALRALNRFEPLGPPVPGGGITPTYQYGVPMSLDLRSLAADVAARTMSDSVGKETVDTMSAHTIWDKLAGQYAPNYLFSVVPMVDRALVVPFTPGLRIWTKTIFAEEYDAIQLQAKLPRPLRGVGIFSGRGSAAGGYSSQPGVPETASSVRIGGYYENDEQRGGMVLFKRGPDWLTNLPVPYLYGYEASAPNGPRGSATHPGAGQPSTQPRPSVLQAQSAYLWQQYARSLYIIEVLKGRGGTIRSRLRFDIAPGSSVRIITAREKYVAAELDMPQTQSTFGTVIRVSISANAESCQAGTVFHVGYVRSALENVSPSFSVSRHPLWKIPWAGAPLIGNHPEFLQPVTRGRLIGEDDEEAKGAPNMVGVILT